MTTINRENISETLSELIKKSKLSVDKIATLTEIPVRFIIALQNGDFSKLPADPYVRGYLIKIAKVLKEDPDELIFIYKNSTSRKISGKKDVLPPNRFKKAAISRGIIISIIIVILLSLFVTLRKDEILGLASLEVTIPKTVNEELLMVEGSVEPGDRLTLNEELVYTDENGEFEKEIALEPGLNTLKFKVKRFLGREKIIIKQVIYEPLPVINTTPPITPEQNQEQPINHQEF